MYQIINVNDYSGGIAEAASYFHSKWGNEGNFMFYLDAMLHSSNEKDGLPRFYLLLKSKEIVGCYALIVNDFISRHDLMPWFASLLVVYLGTAGITALRQRSLRNSKTAHIRSKIVLQTAIQVIGGGVSLLKPPPTAKRRTGPLNLHGHLLSPGRDPKQQQLLHGPDLVGDASRHRRRTVLPLLGRAVPSGRNGLR